MEQECLQALVTDPRRGKNMFALGMLCSIYSLDLALAREQIARTFGKKDERASSTPTSALLDAGRRLGRGEPRLQVPHPRDPRRPSRRSWSTATPRSRSACSPPAWKSARCTRSRRPPRRRTTSPTCSRRSAASCTRPRTRSPPAPSPSAPPTPASARSRSPPVPATRSSRKAIGLAVMAEIPLVVVNVQRGGPSTGQPTKAEQGDLLSAMFGSHGDAPKVVMAREHDRGLLLLGHHRAQDRRDLQHGGGGADRRRPRHLAAAVPAAAVQRDLAGAADRPDARAAEGAKPYDWDPVTGLARRFIPGQPGGMHTLTGLAHDRQQPRRLRSRRSTRKGLRMRSLKLAALQKTLKAPPVFGGDDGRPAASSAGAAPRARSRRRSTRLRGEGPRGVVACTCASCSRCRRASRRSCSASSR